MAIVGKKKKSQNSTASKIPNDFGSDFCRLFPVDAFDRSPNERNQQRQIYSPFISFVFKQARLQKIQHGSATPDLLTFSAEESQDDDPNEKNTSGLPSPRDICLQQIHHCRNVITDCFFVERNAPW
jgi:hypothetical protein